MLIQIGKKQLVQNKLVSPTPNLSIMLPGWCNAKCEFCFWNRDQEANIHPNNNFAQTVANILDSLPDEFMQISVTGGEPTISPVLEEVLDVISQRRNKYTKTVFTTNAVRLAEKSKLLVDVIDHINISRHHYNDEVSNEIFKVKSCPNTKKLKEILKIDFGHADVCFNCVIPPDTDPEFCEKFIDFTQKFGPRIAAINFRIFHNAMDICNAQMVFEERYGATHEAECPVCRVARQVVRGTNVNWKYSILEPTQNWNGIYELVIQPNGDLSADWEGINIVDPNSIEPYEKSVEEELLELRSMLENE